MGIHPSFDIEDLLGEYSPEELIVEISKSECEESFIEFIRQAWHVVEPGQNYLENWHIGLIAAHLEAITDEKILEYNEDDEPIYYNRLLINVPPGAMKSLLVNVFWPAWEWGPRNKPHLRYVCASHSLDLAIRDSTKMRRLIQSEWYQERWGDRVQLTGDQNQKTKFENNKTGFRQAIAAGSITGARGDRVLIDDPHSVEGAASEAQRKTTIEWFLEAVPTRLNNPDRSAIIVIMQRLHQEDVSGVILDKDLGYDHIMLPMEFDPSRAYPTMLGYLDPRDVEGELFFPDRFPASVVERDKKAMGPYAAAGQFQQEPAPRGGEIIKREWWQLWEHERFPTFDLIIASVDTAYTTKQENDFSAMTIWGIYSEEPIAEATRDPNTGAYVREYKQPTPKAILIFAWQERLALSDLVGKIHDCCKRFKVDKLLIENKATGISIEQELRRLYANSNYGLQMVNPGNQDKMARVYSVQHLFSEGLIYAPDRNWAEMVISQAEVFPKGKHDDLVDTVSQALRFMRSNGVLQRSEEIHESLEDQRQHRGAPPAPLYAV